MSDTMTPEQIAEIRAADAAVVTMPPFPVYQHRRALLAHLDAVRAEREREVESIRTERDAWRVFAEHQEVCAHCAESVSECAIGSEMRSIAVALTPAPTTEASR